MTADMVGAAEVASMHSELVRVELLKTAGIGDHFDVPLRVHPNAESSRVVTGMKQRLVVGAVLISRSRVYGEPSQSAVMGKVIKVIVVALP